MIAPIDKEEVKPSHHQAMEGLGSGPGSELLIRPRQCEVGAIIGYRW